MNKIKIGCKEISYLLRKGGKQTILFVHGLGCSNESFSHAFEGDYLPLEYTLVAPDLLGYGDSSKPANYSYSLEQQASLLADFINSLGVETGYIVAHSMGGAIALLLIEKLGGINGFFCLEGNLVPEDCTISKRVSSVEENKFVNDLYPLAPLRFRCRGLESDPAPSAIAFHRSAKSLLRWSSEGDLLGKFNRLQNKVYIYGGENRKAAVLEKLQQSDTIEISGCGHFMMMDNPEETYNAVKKVLGFYALCNGERKTPSAGD